MRKKSITNRLGLAYAFSTLTILLGTIMLFFALNNNYKLLQSMADVYSPSTSLLQQLSHQVTETKMLIKNWVFVSPQTDSPDKIKLKQLLDNDIPAILNELGSLSASWTFREKSMLQQIEIQFHDSLIPAQKDVMKLLNTFEDYNNTLLIFSAQSLVEDESDPVMMITSRLINNINEFMTTLSKKSEDVKNESKKSMNAFKMLIIFIAFSIAIGTFLLASYISRSVIKPLKELDKAASMVQGGKLDIQVDVRQDDEVGTLSENFNKMILSLKEQKDELEEFNQLLLKSQKKLKETNQTKDKFFNIIAHDLKGPFSSFLAITDVLNSDADSLPEDKKQYLIKSLNQSALYLESLLENLLQWARTQSGTLEVNSRCIFLHEIVKQNIRLLQMEAHYNNVEFVATIAEETQVMADPNLLHTVMRNLLSNAVKFSEKGGQVTVSCHDKGKKFIEVSIADQGIGIHHDDLHKLFRIDVSTKTIGESNRKGTGFGLILCKEFVEKQGGQVNVESKLGKGTIFRFTLPKC